MLTSPLKSVFMAVMAIAFLSMQWTTTHIHLAESHTHNNPHHQHSSEAHAHYSSHFSIDARHDHNTSPSTHSSSLNIVELDHEFNHNSHDKAEKSSATLVESARYIDRSTRLASIQLSISSHPLPVNIYQITVPSRAPPRYT